MEGLSLSFSRPPPPPPPPPPPTHTHTHTHTHTYIHSHTQPHRQFKDNEHNVFYVDRHIHPHSLAVIRTRADHLGVQTVVDDFHNFDFSTGTVCGVLVQYPNTDGQINDFSEMIEKAHEHKVVAIHMYSVNLYECCIHYNMMVCW